MLNQTLQGPKQNFSIIEGPKFSDYQTVDAKHGEKNKEQFL